MAENKPVSQKPEQSSQRSGKNAGEDEVQANVDEETEQGFSGEKVDPTPNENYTLQGVVSGAPTPETDADAAEEARQSVAKHRGKK
jgi:hypothetical protein